MSESSLTDKARSIPRYIAVEGPIGVGERVERVARLVARLDGAELA